MAGVIGLFHDVDVPMLRKLPHGLGLVRKERWRRTEQLLVPCSGLDEVANRDSREQVEWHFREHADRIDPCLHEGAFPTTRAGMDAPMPPAFARLRWGKKARLAPRHPDPDPREPSRVPPASGLDLGGPCGGTLAPPGLGPSARTPPLVARLAGTLAGRARTRSTRRRQFGGLVVERSRCHRARAVGPSGPMDGRGTPAGRARLFLPAALRRATAPLGDQELFSDRAARWDERAPVSGR
jgi:hypothetical protein